jgi:hypothetical protein
MLIACSCTKVVSGPTTIIGPELTFKSRYILTIGDSIKDVTAYPPFTTSKDNHLNFLNPNIAAVECSTSWHEISPTGQKIERGCIAQTTSNIASTISHGFNHCTLVQYQNKETSFYSDGTSQDVGVGPQYYVIVKAE